MWVARRCQITGLGRLSAWQGTKRCWIEASADQIAPRTSRRASHVALLGNIVVKILPYLHDYFEEEFGIGCIQ
jgi:hypothetical protein